MRRILSFALLISLTLATTIYAKTYTISANSKLSEVYTANMDTGILTINLGNEAKVFSDMVGHAGQASRTLVSFNNGPALSYENSGSNRLKAHAEDTSLTEDAAVEKITRVTNGGTKGLTERKQFKREITENFNELYGCCSE